MSTKYVRSLNIATIAVVLLGTAIVVARSSRSSAHVAATHVNVGEIGIDFGKAPRTVVIVLQEECHYCEASIPFYRGLLAKRTERGGTFHVAVAAPSRNAGIDTFLSERLFVPDSIALFNRSNALQVPMTPTILVADSTGRVEAMWVGALSRDREEELLNYLFPL